MTKAKEGEAETVEGAIEKIRAAMRDEGLQTAELTIHEAGCSVADLDGEGPCSCGAEEQIISQDAS